MQGTMDESPSASPSSGMVPSTSTAATTLSMSRLTLASRRPNAERPVYKLTVALLDTYKHINDVYYKKKRAQQFNDGYDDKNGDYIIRRGDIVADRYELQSLLGKGSFGQVVEAWDQRKGVKVAVKIIKNRTPFYNQGLVEVRILQHMMKRDPKDKYCIVRMLKHFVFRRHLCIVFELLSYNLYDLLRHTDFQGVSLNLLAKFGHQILMSLYFLANPKVNVIHCDLKPENILLRNPRRSALKVIDYGSSCFRNERMFKYIQSRFYRAPEILLELNYGSGIDMWSLGCILVEMHTGEPIFPGEDEADQMHKICQVLGYPPNRMIEGSPKAKKFFHRTPDGSYALRCLVGAPLRRNRLESILRIAEGGPVNRANVPGHGVADYLELKDLVERMLCFEPLQRITPYDALQHPFLKRSESSASSSKSASRASKRSISLLSSQTGGGLGSGGSPLASNAMDDGDDESAEVGSPMTTS